MKRVLFLLAVCLISLRAICDVVYTQELAALEEYNSLSLTPSDMSYTIIDGVDEFKVVIEQCTKMTLSSKKYVEVSSSSKITIVSQRSDIRSIIFSKNTSSAMNVTPNVGEFSNKTWSGRSKEVVLEMGGIYDIQSIRITYTPQESETDFIYTAAEWTGISETGNALEGSFTIKYSTYTLDDQGIKVTAPLHICITDTDSYYISNIVFEATTEEAPLVEASWFKHDYQRFEYGELQDNRFSFSCDFEPNYRYIKITPQGGELYPTYCKITISPIKMFSEELEWYDDFSYLSAGDLNSVIYVTPQHSAPHYAGATLKSDDGIITNNYDGKQYLFISQPGTYSLTLSVGNKFVTHQSITKSFTIEKDYYKVRPTADWSQFYSLAGIEQNINALNGTIDLYINEDSRCGSRCEQQFSNVYVAPHSQLVIAPNGKFVANDIEVDDLLIEADENGCGELVLFKAQKNVTGKVEIFADGDFGVSASGMKIERDANLNWLRYFDGEWKSVQSADSIEFIPFAAYRLESNESKKYVGEGRLIFENHTFEAAAGQSFFASSYLTPIAIANIEEEDFMSDNKCVYLLPPGSATYIGYPINMAKYLSDSYIKPTQMFMLSSTLPSSLKFDYYDMVTRTPEQEERQSIELKLVTAQYSSQVVLFEDEKAQKGFNNGYDAPLVVAQENAPYIFIKSNEQRYSLKSLSSFVGAEIGIETATTLGCDLYINCNLSDSKSYYLEDRITNKKVEIKDGEVYHFEANIEQNEPRFIIKQAENNAAIEAAYLEKVYVENGKVVCDIPFRLYNLVGQDVTSLNGTLSSGVYILSTTIFTTKIVIK